MTPSVPVCFSVVVPCYNGAGFIQDCLDSVYSSTFSSFELILVDDGSTDGSAGLAESIFHHELIAGRLRVVRQSNSGLSAARNSGVSAAAGNYLIFLDVDDMLHPNAMARLNFAFEQGAEVVEFGHLRFPEDGQPRWSAGSDECYVQSSREKVFRQASWYACFRSYRRSLFLGLMFPIGRFYEDAMTVPFFYLRVNHIFVVEEPLYAYRVNSGGITQRLRPEYMRDLAEYFCWLLPMRGKFVGVHKLGILRLIKELSIMMRDDSFNAFVSTARFCLPGDVSYGAGWRDRLFWRYPIIFNVYISLRTLRAKWRQAL